LGVIVIVRREGGVRSNKIISISRGRVMDGFLHGGKVLGNDFSFRDKNKCKNQKKESCEVLAWKVHGRFINKQVNLK
jgi:hypothetical protein